MTEKQELLVMRPRQRACKVCIQNQLNFTEIHVLSKKYTMSS